MFVKKVQNYNFSEKNKKKKEKNETLTSKAFCVG